MKNFRIGYYGYRKLGDDLFVKRLTSDFFPKDFIEKNWIICLENYYAIGKTTNNQIP